MASMVMVSPKFQIVIPKELRVKLAIRPGQKMLMYEMDGSLYLDVAKSIRELRGLVPGLRWTEDDRDRSDRF
jgi:AbrB family looped-hinge helix DNA binding protein